MSGGVENELNQPLNNLTINNRRDSNLSNNNDVCETAEEAVTTDSEDYLSEPMRYKRLEYSLTSDDSSTTLRAVNEEINDNFLPSGEMTANNIQIPIVGYEVMEERARFTVFKLRIENKASGDCWYVFRRYTDFVRLCNRIKHKYPEVVQYLPRKRYLGNNFDPVFLDERASGLQTLVNNILREHHLVSSQLIQEFFCLNEPPVYSDTNEESRAMFEALEDTIYQLKQQLREKEIIIDSLHDELLTKTNENENLKKVLSGKMFVPVLGEELHLKMANMTFLKHLTIASSKNQNAIQGNNREDSSACKCTDDFL